MLLWIGLGIGIIILVILIRKILTISKHDVLRFEKYCKKCGLLVNGFKCPKCHSN